MDRGGKRYAQPTVKACPRCGREFVPETRATTMCPECAKAAMDDARIRPRVCAVCGRTFLDFPRAKYCPDCKPEVLREQSRATKQRGTARPLGSTDLCVACGKPYIVNSGRQRYCKDCAEREWHKNILAAKRVYMAEYSATRRQRVYKKQICAVCGKPFDCGNANPTVTCSPECAKIQRARSQRRADLKRRPAKGKRLPPSQIGDRYGKLTIIDTAEPNITKGGWVQRRWVCRCDCGNVITVKQVQLRDKRNPVTSCGCDGGRKVEV